MDVIIKEVKIGHINAQSMKSSQEKLTAIKNLVAQYDIFVVSESRLNGFDLEKLKQKIQVEGYNLEVNNRRCHKGDCQCQHLANGGGIVVYLKDTILYRIKEKYNEIEEYHAFQSIHLEIIKINGKEILTGPLQVVAMYNPKGKRKQLIECLDGGLPSLYPVIAIGDVNIDESDENVTFHMKKKIEMGYTQLIKVPTRVVGKTESVIDHIYVTEEKFVSATGLVTKPDPKIADHYLISCSLKLRTKQTAEKHKVIDPDLLNQVKSNCEQLGYQYLNVEDGIIYVQEIDSSTISMIKDWNELFIVFFDFDE